MDLTVDYVLRRLSWWYTYYSELVGRFQVEEGCEFASQHVANPEWHKVTRKTREIPTNRWKLEKKASQLVVLCAILGLIQPLNKQHARY